MPKPSSARIKATIQQTKTGKLILYLSVDNVLREEFSLERGTQPKGLFKVIIR